MSGTRAIADVGAALRTLLEDALRGADPTLGTVRVGSLLSDRSQDAPSESRSRLDLVLLRATESAPSRQHQPTDPHAAAPLAVDLHFLLAVHADDGARAERLLGIAMQALYASPVLTPPAGGPPVRVALQTLPLAELTSLWAALGTRHRLSVCYTAGPVLLGDDARAAS
jgi:hypothetical protein